MSYNNQIEFPSKKDAQALKQSILDYFKKNPSSYCFIYQWVQGIVLPKSESEYIQNMFRYSTQGVVRRCDNYLKKSITHCGKEYILRLESYGDSKKMRMQAGVNPLAYAFGKIMLDHVYLFIEEKSILIKNQMEQRIDNQIQKERYFTALQNIVALENIFEVKLDDKKKTCEERYIEQKNNLSNVQQGIKNMQMNMINNVLNPEHQNKSSNLLNQKLQMEDDDKSQNKQEIQEQLQKSISDEIHQKQASFQNQNLQNQKSNQTNDEIENADNEDYLNKRITQNIIDFFEGSDSNQIDEEISDDEDMSEDKEICEIEEISEEEDINEEEEISEEEIDEKNNINQNEQDKEQSENLKDNHNQQNKESENTQNNKNVEDEVYEVQKIQDEKDMNILINNQTSNINQQENIEQSSSCDELNEEQNNKAIQKIKAISKDKKKILQQ